MLKAGFQIVKWALIFVLSFSTFNLFLSGRVKASIEIDSSPELVYSQVVDLRNWQNWAIWWQEDETMVTTFSDEKTSGKGTYMIWIGEKYKGSLKILDCVENKSISYALYISGDTSSMVTGDWNFQEHNGGVIVNWKFKNKLPFFMRFMSFFITPDLESGLQGLKNLCEQDN